LLPGSNDRKIKLEIGYPSHDQEVVLAPSCLAWLARVLLHCNLKLLYARHGMRVSRPWILRMDQRSGPREIHPPPHWTTQRTNEVSTLVAHHSQASPYLPPRGRARKLPESRTGIEPVSVRGQHAGPRPGRADRRPALSQNAAEGLAHA